MSAPQQRAAVKHLVETGRCSKRRACRFVGVARSTVCYQTCSQTDEAQLVEQLHLLFVEAREAERFIP